MTQSDADPVVPAVAAAVASARVLHGARPARAAPSVAHLAPGMAVAALATPVVEVPAMAPSPVTVAAGANVLNARQVEEAVRAETTTGPVAVDVTRIETAGHVRFQRAPTVGADWLERVPIQPAARRVATNPRNNTISVRQSTTPRGGSVSSTRAVTAARARDDRRASRST